MKILVYGAGNIGSLYAARLAASGEDVSILARGDRLARIRERGIELEELSSGTRTAVSVNAVDALGERDAYDLALVTLGRHCVAEVLPVLARNRHTPSVIFMGNNASGPQPMVEVLGRDRVLLGFPGAAGVMRDGVVRYLVTPAREQSTTIGEIDGGRSARIEALAGALRRAGFPVAISSDIDAWLKTHVAEISPTANALYMVGGDVRKLSHTRDALVLMLRAIREGYRVLDAQGIPVTPREHRIFRWIPEPVLLALMRRRTNGEGAAIRLGHALAARDEMKVVADEFRALAASTSVPTPAMDRLYRHLDPTVETLAEGSAELPLRWLR